MPVTMCRVCDRVLRRTVIDLGNAPLANAFSDQADAVAPTYPLAVGMCEACGTVQLYAGVDPGDLFGGHYAYHSSVNRPYVEQCHRLVDDLIARLALGPDDLVAEIGSNDGYLLSRYADRGVNVVGWEPAANLADAANQRGVFTLHDFFGQPSGEYLAGEARIIHANNVLAHAPDIIGILRGVAAGLAPDGMLVVETPYVAPMVDHCLFDTIYHEHLFYWSVTAFGRACRRAGLALVDVERIASHGGSVRLWVTHQANHWRPSPSIEAMFAEENRRGLHDFSFYADMQVRADHRIRYAQEGLAAMAEQGMRIVGYGAAAKGTMLLHALDLPTGTIDYVADATPDKIGRHMPGTGIEVRHPSTIDQDPPDAILLLAWNWADAIMAQHPNYRGQWFSPMPMFAQLGPIHHDTKATA